MREFQRGVGGAFIDEVNGVRFHDIQIVDNATLGLSLPGDRTVIEDSIVRRNGGIGIQLIGVAGEVFSDYEVRRCQVEDNQGAGIDISGHHSIVESNIVRRNGGNGIAVRGTAQQLNVNRVEDNHGQGIMTSGGGKGDFTINFDTITRNIVLRNSGDGVEVRGTALVDRNQSKYNEGNGFQVGGREPHTVIGNIAVSNGGNGFTVSATGSHFDRNTANYNGRPTSGFGIEDTSSGTGTGGTANTYVDNLCGGNGFGDSSPPGLCR